MTPFFFPVSFIVLNFSIIYCFKIKIFLFAVSKKLINDDSKQALRNQQNIMHSLDDIKNVTVEMKNMLEAHVENSRHYEASIIELLRTQNLLLSKATGIEINE